MDLHRRKLWADRGTWIFVLAASVVITYMYLSRRGPFQMYLLIGWTVIVAALLFVGELRIGRRRPSRSDGALHTGWAAFVGSETVAPDGSRERGRPAAIPGVLEFAPKGVTWRARGDSGSPIELGWGSLFGWRLNSVLPLVGRASGYLTITSLDSEDSVFHIHNQNRWRKAITESAIVGPAAAGAMAGASAPPQPPPRPHEELFPSPEIALGTIEPEQEYEAVIGLECHVELSTNSKVFCGCSTSFGAEPNSQICPVCTGQPGTLPVLNSKAVEYALKIGIALNCRIASESVFHRKNYFYPDMPKNFQISQYDIPLASGGFLEIEADGAHSRVGITRVHLEEDTGKTSHAGGNIAAADASHVDYNRAGVPLVEIVSEPDIRTPEQARVYLSELRVLLASLGVSDVRMEEGSLRCDANVSVRPKGSYELGTKAEVKNMNSVRSVGRALSYEIERQTELLRAGAGVVQETRHFDETTQTTSTLRSKEFAFDYRYFPEPDLVPLVPDEAWLDSIRASIPELPAARRYRFIIAHGLSEPDSRNLIATPALADAYEAAVAAYSGEPKAIARWYLGELAAEGNTQGVGPHEIGVSPEALAELQVLVDSGEVSISLAKSAVLREMISSGRGASDIVAAEGLAQITGTDELDAIVSQVVSSNEEIVAQVRSGKLTAVNALVGKVMAATQGRANPQAATALIKQHLGLPEA